jgi:PAS domain S-box-containing protein
MESIHPEDRKRRQTSSETAFKKHVPYTLEYRLRRYDGEYRWVSDDGQPRFDEKNRFIGYIGFCHDITDQKNTENLLVERENHCREHLAKLNAAGVIL